MLTLTPPDDELREQVAACLKSRWMPGDWFELTPQVIGHYAWKAAVCRAAWQALCNCKRLQIIEIGTRCGYSLSAFLVAMAKEPCEVEALCFDAGLDADSPACLTTFRTWVRHTRLPANLVQVNTRHIEALPWCHFAHVDACHTYDGALHDLRLVRHAPVILADDCDNQEVRAAVMAFLRECEPTRRVQFVNDGLRLLGVISGDGPTGNTGPRG